MATLTINVPNAQAVDIRDSLATFWGYTGNPADNTAKMEFIRTYVAAFLKEQYIIAKSNIAAQQASDAAKSTAQQVDIN